jgi:PAS domain S-box-containing protein
MNHESEPVADRRMPLRVLLIEDSEDDALLLLRVLRQGGYETTARRVETLADLEEALANETWDIVFCDYAMPRMSGPEAIAVIRARPLDVPVIMVSGEVGEEYAVAAMKAGANDFVMKTRLSRLVPAAERELLEAEMRRARKRAEAELRDTQERYQLLVEQAPIGIVVVDATGQVAAANPAAVAILGSPSEEATRHFNVLTLPNLRRSGISASYERVLQGGPPERVEDWYTSFWGKRSLLRFEVTSLRDVAGAVRGAITIVQDLTEWAQAQAARRQSEEQLRELVDSVEGVLWEADAQTFEFLFVSSKAEHLLGYPPDAWLGDPDFWADHVHPEDRERTVALCRSATEALQNHTFECRMTRADGRIVWVRDFVTVSAEGGRPARLRGILLDVTAQRDAAAALRRSQDELQTLNRELERRVAERTAQLEAANRELQAFGYSVSHDLIAPLRAVDGYIRMIVEDEGAVLSNQSRARLRRVLAATGRMGTLIDRLLELSRVTRAEMNRGRVDLSVLASGIAADLQHAEPARRVEFTIARDLVADADPLLARVVLENLLRNAWKYSSRRPLTQIAVESVADTHPPVYVVRDNGAGFDMSEAERLFVAFQRLHDADEFDGAGIGLATTMRVIQRHGGRIWAEGAVDQGAAFFFTLEPG